MKSIFDELTTAPETSTHLDNADIEAFDSDTETATQKESDVPPIIDSQRTDGRLREATQYLLSSGLLEQANKANLYRIALTYLADINRLLEPLDLQAQADDIRGLIFLKVLAESTDDNWSHPMVRKQRLTLEQSLLLAILRQYFVNHEQESGMGAGDAVVSVDELIPQLQVYFGDSGSESKERNRAITLLDQLKGHGVVTAPDAHGRVTIRPIIAHLANPENLQALLRALQAQAVTDVAVDVLLESPEDDE